MAAPRPGKLLLMNRREIYKLLKSCAWALAAQKYTALEWREDRSNMVMNACTTLKKIMYLDFGGSRVAGFGYAHLKTGTSTQVGAETAKITRSLLRKFDYLCHTRGPRAAVPWLRGRMSSRERTLRVLKDTYTGARQVNQMVIDELTTSIKYSARIKLAADVGLATLGALPIGGGAIKLTQLGINAGYPMIVNLINHWSQGPDADVAGWLLDQGGTGASEMCNAFGDSMWNEAKATLNRLPTAANAQATQGFMKGGQNLAVAGAAGKCAGTLISVAFVAKGISTAWSDYCKAVE